MAVLVYNVLQGASLTIKYLQISCLIKYAMTETERDFMVMSLLFKFLEDWMSGFEVEANDILTTQVPAANLNMHGLTKIRRNGSEISW